MKEPLDPRSTQRKRARKVMFNTGVPYICGSPNFDTTESCGRSPKELPKDAPKTLELAHPDKQFVSVGLQVNHINKNIMDNDPANLQYLCASCHKVKDSKTEKGVSIKGNDEHGYLV